MARLALLTLCVTASFAGVKSATPLSYGMTMSSRAFQAVCWYETLKIFPETHSDQYGQCGTQAQQVQQQIEHPDAQNKAYMESSPDAAMGMFGQFFGDLGTMDTLPNSEHYKSACKKYLKTPKADPPSDESDALNDKYKKTYPYKAFAHCMMKALREQHGEEAINAVKNERTHSRKNWMQTLLDRENEFRARHGVPPLQLVKDLNDAAQQWAATNAKECNMYHSEDDSRKWNGEATGESLSAGGGEDDSGAAAYQAADGWYEEIKDYPYPDGYQGGDEALFEKIGHFTQSVWKDSKYVGYGYAFNNDCSGYNHYVAARYFPAGNMEGKYPENVLPPKT